MSDRQFPSFNRQQADIIVEKMKELLGPDITQLIEESGLNPNYMLRFRQVKVASLCKNSREQKRLSLREVSKLLKMRK